MHPFSDASLEDGFFRCEKEIVKNTGIAFPMPKVKVNKCIPLLSRKISNVGRGEVFFL